MTLVAIFVPFGVCQLSGSPLVYGERELEPEAADLMLQQRLQRRLCWDQSASPSASAECAPISLAVLGDTLLWEDYSAGMEDVHMSMPAPPPLECWTLVSRQQRTRPCCRF